MPEFSLEVKLWDGGYFKVFKLIPGVTFSARDTKHAFLRLAIEVLDLSLSGWLILGSFGNEFQCIFYGNDAILQHAEYF